MRVLYVSHSFPLPGNPLSNVGGMQRVATGLHAALSARGDVRLSALLLETSWKATPYRMPGYLAGLLRRIPRVVEEEDAAAAASASAAALALASSSSSTSAHDFFSGDAALSAIAPRPGRSRAIRGGEIEKKQRG